MIGVWKPQGNASRETANLPFHVKPHLRRLRQSPLRTGRTCYLFMRCLHGVQLGQTRSHNFISEPSSPVIGCVCLDRQPAMEEINAGQKSRTLHSRGRCVSWRRQTTAKIKTSANMNCNDIAPGSQGSRSRERSWNTLPRLPDGRKKRWTIFGSPTLSNSWHSALQCCQGVPAWRQRILSPPRRSTALNGRMPTFRRRSHKHCPAFSFFHPRPARNIASIPSIARTLLKCCSYRGSEGGPHGQDNYAVAPSNFVALFSERLPRRTKRTRQLRGGTVKLPRTILRETPKEDQAGKTTPWWRRQLISPFLYETTNSEESLREIQLYDFDVGVFILFSIRKSQHLKN